MEVIAVVRLGYVGLPLAVAFGKLLPTIVESIVNPSDRHHTLANTIKVVPDLCNSKMADLISERRAYGLEVFVHDPITDASAACAEHGIELPTRGALLAKPYAAYSERVNERGCFIDVKSQFDASRLSAAGLEIWRL